MTSEREPGLRSYKSFTVLDWIGVAMATFFGLVPILIRLVGVPAFASMFEEFEAALPIITRVSFTWWFPLIMSGIVIAAVTAAVFGKRLAVSRLVGALAFILALGIIAFYFIALYSPLMIPVELVR